MLFFKPTSSASTSARRRIVVFGLGQFPERLGVIEMAAQVFDPADFALDVGQLAGDLLRILRIVPEIRRGGLFGQRGAVAAQLRQIDDRFDAGQRRRQILEARALTSLTTSEVTRWMKEH